MPLVTVAGSRLLVALRDLAFSVIVALRTLSNSQISDTSPVGRIVN